MPELATLKLQHGNDWILNQNPRHYTLQVVAGQNVKTIEEFIEEHQVKDNIALYKSVRKGNPWYGLILGNYDNKAQAVAAVSQLPKKIQREKPWIRDIKGIQSDIRKAQPVESHVTQPVVQPVTQNNMQPTLTERLSRPAPVVTTAKDIPAIEISRREDWILRQRDRHNTLQLMANSRLDTITRFVNVHQMKDSIALYQTTQNGKPLYVLIYGIYPTTDLATTAISQLPLYLQELKPTIRQYSDIHQEIRQTQAGN
jgi:septal ring-binding cell division protein DamX